MSSPVNVGDILASKYQVERVLGVGGMGVVVAAKHLILGERVAIKFLLPQALAREDVVKRFIQEGMAANRLRGEHIGRVHDVGKLPSGAPYLVMEYLDGRDLGAILREEGRLPVERAVDYVVQACEALAEAHSASIVHRDLKPSNLFVIKRLDGTPSVKLIDFGISKMQLPSADGAEGEMTATAVMMGSPLYMAPEQMASAKDVDGRADIWSLGIILHTMLTGQPPFRAPSVMQIYELIVQGAPPIRKTRADVPEEIEAAILKCLQKDRRQRFANVGELAAAIAGHGPPEAHFDAERIKRIVSVRSTRDSLPAPSSTTPGAEAPPAPAPAPAPDSLGGDPGTGAGAGAGRADVTPPPVDSAGASPPSTAAAIDAHGTGGPWDQKTHPPSPRWGTPPYPRRTRPAALIAAVAAVLIGGPAAFFALRADHGASKPPADSANAQGVAVTPAPPESPKTPVSVEPVQPSVVPGSSQPVTSASTAPAPPKPETTATAHARRPALPPGPPRSRVKSPDDLFGTQK